MERYKGLLISMRPSVNFIRTVNKEYLEGYKYFPVRCLIGLEKRFIDSSGEWEQVNNENAVEEKNKRTLFFEHVWGAEPESVILNEKSGYSLEQLIEIVENNKSKVGVEDAITSVRLNNGIELKVEDRGNRVITKVEVEGLGPLFARVHKKSGGFYRGSGGRGEILLHLNKPTIKVIEVKQLTLV